MSLDDIVSVNITSATVTPSRPGFGTPLVLAYHTRWTNGRVREYFKLTELTDDSFLVTDPTYLAVQAAFAQNPRPKSVKVGRRTRAFTQTIMLTPVTTTAGFVYSVTIAGVTATYTNGGSETVATICTALASAINGLSNTSLHTATASSTAVMVATNAAGTLLDYTNFTGEPNMMFADVTTDPGVVSDLSDVIAEDADFYGLALDSNSGAEVEALATNVETQTLLFVFNTSDSECYNPSSTTDVMSVLKSHNYARTIGLFSKAQLLSYSGLAWMANRFPFPPGSDTWAHKTLNGIQTDVMTPAQVNAILAKRGNVYTAIAGVSVTQFGKTFANEWADVTRGIDWLKSEVQIRVFTLLVNNQKIPYTDSGVDQVKSAIQGALDAGIQVGLLAKSPAPYVTAPLVADVDTTTKGDRILPDVEFFGTLAGAIHQVQIAGTLSI